MSVKTRLVDSKLGQLSEPTGSFKDLCLSHVPVCDYYKCERPCAPLGIGV